MQPSMSGVHLGCHSSRGPNAVNPFSFLLSSPICLDCTKEIYIFAMIFHEKRRKPPISKTLSSENLFFSISEKKPLPLMVTNQRLYVRCLFCASSIVDKENLYDIYMQHRRLAPETAKRRITCRNIVCQQPPSCHRPTAQRWAKCWRSWSRW